MILPPHMAFTACPIRIDIEGSSCLIICHVNVISSLAPELLFRMVKALIHFIISFLSFNIQVVIYFCLYYCFYLY